MTIVSLNWNHRMLETLTTIASLAMVTATVTTSIVATLDIVTTGTMAILTMAKRPATKHLQGMMRHIVTEVMVTTI